MRWFLYATLLGSLCACSKKEGARDGGSNPNASSGKAPQCVNDAHKRQSGAKLSACTLAADWSIGKLKCRKDRLLELHPDGALKRCSLVGPTDVSGFGCQENTELYEDGKFKGCKLTASKTVNGIDVRADDWITVYKSGTLKRVQLNNPAKLKGLPCKGFFNYFHENGQLKKCELADVAKIDEQEVPAGTLVCLDDKGKRVSDCKLLNWDLLD